MHFKEVLLLFSHHHTFQKGVITPSNFFSTYLILVGFCNHCILFRHALVLSEVLLKSQLFLFFTSMLFSPSTHAQEENSAHLAVTYPRKTYSLQEDRISSQSFLQCQVSPFTRFRQIPTQATLGSVQISRSKANCTRDQSLITVHRKVKLQRKDQYIQCLNWYILETSPQKSPLR